MKKTSAILGIVCGGLNAIASLYLMFVQGIQTNHYYSYYYYSNIYETHLNQEAIFLWLLIFTISVCLIVFSALMLRQGRQKGFAVTAFVFSCLLLSIIPLVLFWVYLGTSGTKKTKTEEFDRIAFLKKAREEKIISETEYKKLMIAEIEKQ